MGCSSIHTHLTKNMDVLLCVNGCKSIGMPQKSQPTQLLASSQKYVAALKWGLPALDFRYWYQFVI